MRRLTLYVRVLGALAHDAIPTILVMSKCDHSPKSWRVTPNMIDDMKTRFKDVESFQTALSSPETHKRCVSIMLRHVMLFRHGNTSREHCILYSNNCFRL